MPELFSRLEPRRLLATIAFDGGPTGMGTDWQTAANWAGDVLPGPNDDVVIGMPSNPTITLNSFALVRSVTTANNINIGVITTLSVMAGITLAGSGTGPRITLNASSRLEFRTQVQSLSGTGEVYLNAAGAANTSSIGIVNGAALTIDPGITLQTGSGAGGATIGTAGATLLNRGAIHIDGPGAASRFIAITGAWRNEGEVTLAIGEFRMQGTFSTADMGTITRTGGTMVIGGTLNNAGTTLNLGTLPWRVDSGAVLGGQVIGAAGLAVFVGSQVHFADVTIGSPLALTLQTLIIDGRFAAAPGVEVALTGVAQQFIVFTGDGSIYGHFTRSGDPRLTLQGAADHLLTIEDGTVITGASGDGLSVLSGSGTGRVHVSAGATIQSAGTNSIVRFDGTCSNEGSVLSQGGQIFISGAFTNTGTIGGSARQIIVYGTLDITGTTLVVGSPLLTLNNGTIRSGTISAGSTALAMGGAGTLDGVSIGSNVAFSRTPGSTDSVAFGIRGGFTVIAPATVTLDHTNLTWLDQSAMEGRVDVGNVAAITGAAGVQLSIGPGCTLRTVTSGNLTLLAGAAGGSLSIAGTVENSAGMRIGGAWAVTSTGTIRTLAGTLTLQGTTTGASAARIVRTSGFLVIQAVIDGAGETLDLGNNANDVTGNGSTFRNIAIRGGPLTRLLGLNLTTLDNVTVGVAIDSGGGAVTIHNTLAIESAGSFRGGGGQVLVDAGATLIGPGALTLDGSALRISPGQTFTVAAGAAIRMGPNSSTIGATGPTGHLVIRGRISSEGTPFPGTQTIGDSNTSVDAAGATIIGNAGLLVLNGNYIPAGLEGINITRASLMGTLDNTGTVWRPASTLLFSGLLLGGRVEAQAPGFRTLGAILQDVTVAAPVVSMENTTIRGTLTLDGAVFTPTGTLIAEGDARLDGTTTIDATNLTLQAPAGTSLTLGSGITLTSTAATTATISFIADAGGRAINQGRILSARAATTITLGSAGRFENQGTVESMLGTVTIGLLSPTAAASSTWSNGGTYRLNGGRLALGGHFVVGDLGTLDRSSGTLAIGGVLDNTTGFLDAANFGGAFSLEGAAVSGGTIRPAAGVALLVKNSQFSGVQVSGDLLVRALLTVFGPLTLTGVVTIDGTGGTNASITFAGAVAGTLNAAQAVLVTGTIVNSSNSASATLPAALPVLVQSGSNTISSNFGVGIIIESLLSIAPGATLTLSSNVTNHAIQTITTGGRLAITLSTSWHNDGVIHVAGGVLELRGTFTSLAAIGPFDVTSGLLEVSGTITNTGRTLDLTALPPLQLRGTGHVTGGTLVLAPGRTLVSAASTGVLDSVTVQGTGLVTGDATLTLNGLTVLNGTLTLGAGMGGGSGILRLSGTINGTGTVILASDPSSTTQSVVSSSTTASSTVSAGLTLRATGAPSTIGAGTGFLLDLRGLIVADGVGVVLTVGTDLLNLGAIRATDGATINVQGTRYPSSTNVLSGTLWEAIGPSSINFPAGAPILTISSGTTVRIDGAGAMVSDLSQLRSLSGVLILRGRTLTVTPAINLGDRNLSLLGRLDVAGGGRLAVNGRMSLSGSPVVVTTLDAGAPAPVAVTGEISLAGTLNLALAATFPPPVPGQSLPIISAATVVGSFSTVTLPGAPPLVRASLVTDVGVVNLRFTSVIDFNGDGLINPDDLSDFINAFFDGSLSADVDRNGILNPDDLADFITAYFG